MDALSCLSVEEGQGTGTPYVELLKVATASSANYGEQ